MNLIEDAEVQCPHCGEVFVIAVETAQASTTMTEDCAVCCRPIVFHIQCAPGEVLGITATAA